MDNGVGRFIIPIPQHIKIFAILHAGITQEVEFCSFPHKQAANNL